jgi:hypothetical protein
MKTTRRVIFIALALTGLAAFLRFWIAPNYELLQTNYKNDIQLSEENQFRATSTDPWLTSTLDVRRVDRAVMSNGNVLIIEGGLHIYFADGKINFENSNLYGVDQRTRLNLPNYGDTARRGQYLFPPHVQQTEYQIWDPMFIGLRQATFARLDQVEGLQVFVFTFSASGMDESDGYSYLPEVPEIYLAHTDGQGTLWVEPLSGAVVDYEDSGVSYFVDPANGNRVADFNKWTEKYTATTQVAQMTLARQARQRILLLETWLPGGLLLAGVFMLAFGLVRNFVLKRAQK